MTQSVLVNQDYWFPSWSHCDILKSLVWHLNHSRQQTRETTVTPRLTSQSHDWYFNLTHIWSTHHNSPRICPHSSFSFFLNNIEKIMQTNLPHPYISMNRLSQQICKHFILIQIFASFWICPSKFLNLSMTRLTQKHTSQQFPTLLKKDWVANPRPDSTIRISEIEIKITSSQSPRNVERRSSSARWIET